MSHDREHPDDDRVFVRSTWGTNRYVYNPRNPVGRVLIVGSLLFAAGALYALYQPDLFRGGWESDDLGTAVTGATTKLSQEKQFGPGSAAGLFPDIVKQEIARHGHGPEDALTVTLASDTPESTLYEGGPEDADYSVTARGTDTAFCLHVHAVQRPKATGYDAVDFTVDDGSCPGETAGAP
ncbi:hypothetical protein [Streptomyces sp. NPDC055134]